MSAKVDKKEGIEMSIHISLLKKILEKGPWKYHAKTS